MTSAGIFCILNRQLCTMPLAYVPISKVNWAKTKQTKINWYYNAANVPCFYQNIRIFREARSDLLC